MYRFIRMNSDGTLIAETYQNFQSAYRRCLPDVMDDYHVKMAAAAQQDINNQMGDEPILISWNEAPAGADLNTYVFTACWIQLLYNNALRAFPALTMP